MDENAIVEYLNRKDLQYKENAEEFMIRECMFCPKPHYNKADNLYKLLLSPFIVIFRYISKKTGAFICHRCGTCGSWFDFKRKQGDLQSDQSVQTVVPSNDKVNPSVPDTTDSWNQVHQFAYNAIKEYTANLRDKVYPSVWKSLTDRTPTGRWLTEETLRKK